MANFTLEYMSAIAKELANLAEINGYPSLAKLLQGVAEEADHLQTSNTHPTACVRRHRTK